ncbi:phospholipid-transporting ATPase ABCA1 isoform X2 [Synchiropus splendidus]|nr:phospholipid-transporting ATPase ABCA1 isoform X2 [Synchiropus splendidus]
MGIFTRLFLVLWKNITYRRRNKIQLIIELFWPLFLFLILISVRHSHRPYKQSQCHFPNKALPSAGTLPWIQGVVCNVNNPCFHSPTPGETPGQVSNFDNSILSRVLADAQTVLSYSGNYPFAGFQNLLNSLRRLGEKPETWPIEDFMRNSEKFSSFLLNNASLSPETVTKLLKARLNFQVVAAAAGSQMQIKDLVCNKSMLGPFLTDDGDEETMMALQTQLCDLPAHILDDAERLFLSQLDLSKILNRDLLLSNSGDFMAVSQSAGAVFQDIAVMLDYLSSFSSFRELNAALHVLSPWNRTSNPKQNFKTFSNIICGQKTFDGEQIPYLNWYELNDIKSFMGRNGTEDKHLDQHNNTTPYCKKLIQSFEDDPLSQIVWRGLKPMFIGKVLYAPNTPAVQQVMKAVNETFKDFQILQQLNATWTEVGPQIKKYMKNSSGIQLLQNLLKWPEFAVLLDLRLENTSWTASRLAHFLSTDPSPGSPGPPTWLDVYNNFSQTLAILAQVTECFSPNKLEGLESEERLIDRALELIEDRQFWAGVVFMLPNSSSDVLPPHVVYKIRMDIDDVSRTHRIKSRLWNPGPRANPFNDLRYIWGGFVYIQDLVERAVTAVQTGVSQTTGIYVQQMPYPCFVDDVFLRVSNNLLPLFMTLAWIYSVAMLIKGLVYEKEARLKETMRIMGLGTGTLWLSWFITSIVPFMVSSGLLISMLKWGEILPYSNPAVVFLFLSAFATATIMLCFFISSFFSRANLSAACGGLIYFGLYLPFVLCMAWREHINTVHKVLVSFLSPVAFGFGCVLFSQYEEQGVGVQWSNWNTSPVEGDTYSFVTSITMLYLDAFIYGTLAWYIEAVFPGEYGIAKPWNFIFMMNYWGGVPLETGLPIPPAPTEQDDDHIEPDPTGLVLGVSIQNLVKIYKKGAKLALNHLNLKFFEGQITSFLGHNGAGKTTAISVLTGLFPPSSGTVYFKGLDIRHDMDIIRKNLGVCPQHNVLFDILTVEEHVWFYGCLKGLSAAEVRAELDTLLSDIDLLDKRHELTKNLSGGMQRKLSVAIAFVGGSKVVVLDEPTAGVDPYSRRRIWDLLQKYRKDRTIILSTHYMDEAELLGDRIAIISHGRLCCCGTPLFLKSKLGSGYYLTLVKKEGLTKSTHSSTCTNKLTSLTKCGELSINQDTALESECSYLAALLSLAQHHIPGTQLVEESGSEVVINFPQACAKDSSLGVFLSELDQRMGELGISSYGLSDSSLEEIFLRVAEDNSDAELRHASQGEQTQRVENGAQVTDPLNLDEHVETPVTGWWLAWQQLRALFIKRWHYACRSRRGVFAQIVLPAVFVLAALIFSVIIPPFGDNPSLELQPWMYGEQFTFISNDAPGQSVMVNLLDALLDEPGFGTKCMEKEGKEDNINSSECSSPLGGMFLRPQVSYSTWQMFNKGNWTSERPSPNCHCSTDKINRMLPECPQGAGGLPPPQIKRPTGDILQNLTSHNITDYLVKTYTQLLKKSMKTKKWVNELRYGGFSLGGKTSQNVFDIDHVQSSILALRKRFHVPENSSLDHFLKIVPSFYASLNSRDNVKVWYNNKGWHAMVSFVNVMNNGLLRASLPPGPARRRHGITAYNHPLNLDKEQITDMVRMTTTVDALISICVIFAMSFVPAGFVLFLIEERASKAKHLQFVCGVKPILYWLANFAWDMINYCVPATMVILIFLCFNQKAYVLDTNLPALALLLLLYGWSITPLMYPASFIFTVPSTAYVVLICINLFIGVNVIIATFVLELFKDEYLNEVNRHLKKIFLIFPHFCLGRGLLDMAKNQAMTDAFQRFGSKRAMDPLEWDVLGKNIIFMLIEGIIFFILTILLEYKFFIHLRPWWTRPLIPPQAGPEDEDVAQERQRVKSGSAHSDILTMVDLSKIYKAGKKPAVDHLCLGIPRGECFGLLGVNGAGKTSTFRMLTGDTPISFGEAFIHNYSVQTEMDSVHQLMGYCPQFDAISDPLTGREHLELYARLRGVPEHSVRKVAHWGIQKLGLTQYAEWQAGTYSGGNKRKLSTAISFIGAPPVIFLDEPTTGMDPKAKRFLWNCILSVTKEGQAVVLTSHSMEECEALCARMAIMVNGKFQCLGSVQHLKSRFGDGYTVVLRLAEGKSCLGSCPVDEFMKSLFPSMELKECHQNVLQYQFPSHGCSLAKVFDVLAKHFEELGIMDFSVSQTTLDQVFVNFAKEQLDDFSDMLVTNRAERPSRPVLPIHPPTTQIQPTVATTPEKTLLQQERATPRSSKKGKPKEVNAEDTKSSSNESDVSESTSHSMLKQTEKKNRKDPSKLFIVGKDTEETPL